MLLHARSGAAGLAARAVVCARHGRSVAAQPACRSGAQHGASARPRPRAGGRGWGL